MTATFWWILGGGLLMAAVALVGGLTVFLSESRLERLLGPLVGLAAGSLIGGALFHLLPGSVAVLGNSISVYAWVAMGFVGFFALEQILHWHHCHRPPSRHRRPITYLLLVGDGLHNLLGGMAVAGAFLIDIRLGITAWIAAASHEIPQELGDFGVLVAGGWERRSALFFNFISALGFPLGGLLVLGLSHSIDLGFLMPFAAGNFLYIGAADLIPEIRGSEGAAPRWQNLVAFFLGLSALLGVHLVFAPMESMGL
jgi:zinc and cadmium transporter